MDEQINEFIDWLKTNCGGGCTLNYAIAHYGSDIVEMSLGLKRTELKGEKPNPDIQVFRG